MAAINQYMQPQVVQHQNPYVSQHIPLPFEAIMRAGQIRDHNYDEGVALGEQNSNFLNLQSLEEDTAKLNNMISSYQGRMDEAVKDSGGDYGLAASRLRSIGREIKTDLARGYLGEIQNSMNNWGGSATKISEGKKDNNRLSDAEAFELSQRRADFAAGGGTVFDPEKGEYTTFGSADFESRNNYSEDLLKFVDKWAVNGWQSSEEEGGYFRDKGGKYVEFEEVRKAAEKYLKATPQFTRQMHLDIAHQKGKRVSEMDPAELDSYEKDYIGKLVEPFAEKESFNDTTTKLRNNSLHNLGAAEDLKSPISSLTLDTPALLFGGKVATNDVELQTSITDLKTAANRAAKTMINGITSAQQGGLDSGAFLRDNGIDINSPTLYQDILNNKSISEKIKIASGANSLIPLQMYANDMDNLRIRDQEANDAGKKAFSIDPIWNENSSFLSSLGYDKNTAATALATVPSEQYTVNLAGEKTSVSGFGGKRGDLKIRSYSLAVGKNEEAMAAYIENPTKAIEALPKEILERYTTTLNSFDALQSKAKDGVTKFNKAKNAYLEETAKAVTKTPSASQQLPGDFYNSETGAIEYSPEVAKQRHKELNNFLSSPINYANFPVTVIGEEVKEGEQTKTFAQVFEGQNVSDIKTSDWLITNTPGPDGHRQIYLNVQPKEEGEKMKRIYMSTAPIQEVQKWVNNPIEALNRFLNTTSEAGIAAKPLKINGTSDEIIIKFPVNSNAGDQLGEKSFYNNQNFKVLVPRDAGFTNEEKSAQRKAGITASEINTGVLSGADAANMLILLNLNGHITY